MRIAVLGTGRVGKVLGTRWAEKGHQVTYGSRDPGSDRARQLIDQSGGKVSVAPIAHAVSHAEVVLGAIPYDACEDTLKSLGDLKGRILIDCSNPLLPDLSGLYVGHTISAAEQVAEWALGSRVVKAFNTVSSATMANPRYESQSATLFYCGDDPSAKEAVRQLASDLDFDPVDAGPLSIARYLEPLAMLYIHLAIKQGWGSNSAFRIMRRSASGSGGGSRG